MSWLMIFSSTTASILNLSLNFWLNPLSRGLSIHMSFHFHQKIQACFQIMLIRSLHLIGDAYHLTFSVNHSLTKNLVVILNQNFLLKRWDTSWRVWWTRLVHFHKDIWGFFEEYSYILSNLLAQIEISRTLHPVFSWTFILSKLFC